MNRRAISLCIDARMIQCSGIGTFLKNILQALSGKVLLTVLCWKNERELVERFGPAQIILMKSPLYSIREQFELAFKIPKTTIFWSPHFNIPLLPIRAKKRMVTIHDAFHLAHFDTLSFLQKCYALLFYNAAMRISDYMTTVSEFSKNEILRFCKNSKKEVYAISNCVSAHFERGVDRNALDHIKKKYGLPAQFILSVGNQKPHKNLKRLIAAYEGAIVVIGGKKGRVKNAYFLGKVPDEEMAAFYALAEVFVFPSLYEGFGLPPLEAMHCGCPVVASAIAPLKEVCGEAAVYVDPLDVVSIREGIERVMASSVLKKELVEKGFSQAKKFGRERFAERYHTILEEVVCA